MNPRFSLFLTFFWFVNSTFWNWEREKKKRKKKLKKELWLIILCLDNLSLGTQCFGPLNNNEIGLKTVIFSFFCFFHFLFSSFFSYQKIIWKDLGPQLEQEGFGDVKIMILDDQRNVISDWVPVVLGDPDAYRYVAGTGVHWFFFSLFSSSLSSLFSFLYPFLVFFLTFSEGMSHHFTQHWQTSMSNTQTNLFLPQKLAMVIYPLLLRYFFFLLKMERVWKEKRKEKWSRKFDSLLKIG